MSICSEERAICRGCSRAKRDKKTDPVCQQCLEKGKVDAFQRMLVAEGGLNNLAKFGVAPSLPDRPSGRYKMQI